MFPWVWDKSKNSGFDSKHYLDHSSLHPFITKDANSFGDTFTRVDEKISFSTGIDTIQLSVDELNFCLEWDEHAPLWNIGVVNRQRFGLGLGGRTRPRPRPRPRPTAIIADPKSDLSVPI